MRNISAPIDAVLLIAFGGPRGREDIRPFLANILKGRPVPPQRIEEVVRIYERYDGVSPLPEITFRQAATLEKRLRQSGINLPVYVGMRCWPPYLTETLSKMARDGVRRAIGIVASPFHSPASCFVYKQAVADARRQLRDSTGCDIAVTYVDSWYNHPGFVAAHVGRIRQALGQLGPEARQNTRIIFSAHSIPLEMARRCRYREQLAEAADLIMNNLTSGDRKGAGNRHLEHALVYQSRSGRPEEPWLEPEVCAYLRREREKGLSAAVLSPLGFLTEHIEVMYELDERAMGLCHKLGVPAVRAAALNDDPVFIDMLVALVQQTYARNSIFYPLPLTASTVISLSHAASS